MTRGDVEAEHLAALQSLDGEQRIALHRVREALRNGNFSHHSMREELHRIFEREADERGSEFVSPEMIEHEHIVALARLDRAQRHALHRIDRALHIANFSHQTIKNLLLDIFEREASERRTA